MKARKDLYLDYCHELARIDPEQFTDFTDEDAVEVAEDYEASAYWCDIIDEEELCGFVIFAVAPECHPDADYFIAQAFVSPAYRKKGLMTDAVKDFIKLHPGIYCALVIKDNKSANDFWQKLMKSIGYKDYELSAYEGEFKERLIQYGWCQNPH